MIELDTLPVWGEEPRAARWRKRLMAWLHREGLCDRPYVVALAWRPEGRLSGSNGLSNAGVMYAASPRDAAVKRLLMVGGGGPGSEYILVAVTTGHDDDHGTFFDEMMRELSMEEAVALVAETREPD
jgi:hypothetical protein